MSAGWVAQTLFGVRCRAAFGSLNQWDSRRQKGCTADWPRENQTQASAFATSPAPTIMANSLMIQLRRFMDVLQIVSMGTDPPCVCNLTHRPRDRTGESCNLGAEARQYTTLT